MAVRVKRKKGKEKKGGVHIVESPQMAQREVMVMRRVVELEVMRRQCDHKSTIYRGKKVVTKEEEL